jgi:hypothetical protein
VDGWTAPALAAAITVLAGAVFAVALGAAKTFAQIRDIVEGLNRAGVAVRGARGTAGGAAPHSMVTRGAPLAVRPLLGVDAVSQMAGVTVTPAPAPTGPVDCGPACVVSCIEELKGCWSADELLRLRYFGVVDSRLTTADDLVGMLRANGLAAHARKGIDSSTMRQEVIRNWEAGRPSIVLGNYSRMNAGHWVKFLGDRNGPAVMNPYPGITQVWGWDDFLTQYYGDYVHIDGYLPLNSSVAT